VSLEAHARFSKTIDGEETRSHRIPRLRSEYLRSTAKAVFPYLSNEEEENVELVALERKLLGSVRSRGEDHSGWNNDVDNAVVDTRKTGNRVEREEKNRREKGRRERANKRCANERNNRARTSCVLYM